MIDGTKVCRASVANDEMTKKERRLGENGAPAATLLAKRQGRSETQPRSKEEQGWTGPRIILVVQTIHPPRRRPRRIESR
jgi:hypothetical protein